MATCCSVTLTGFCLNDGTPIGIVVRDGTQTDWINFTTGITTLGPPPAGTKTCPETVEIGPLNCATDSITICPPASGILVSGTVSVTEPVSIDDNGGSVTVDAVDFDVRNLVFATDKVDVSGSNVTVTEPITVDAIDFDVRNLTFIADKIDASGSSIALDAATLAALETITVNQGTNPWTVTVNNFPAGLTNTELRASPVSIAGTVDSNVLNDTAIHKFKPGVRTTRVFTIATLGDNTIVTPTVGTRLRVFWVGYSSSENNTAEVLALLKFGTNPNIYGWYLGAPGAFSHWEPVEGGLNEPLIVNLSGAQSVQVNVTFEEFV